MAELVFYKDKNVDFKCQINISGNSTAGSFARLCLEFKEENYFFKGKILENGTCIFKIPKLKNISEEKGFAFIEVVADSSYFKVFESNIKVKQALTVEFKIEDQSLIEDSVNEESYTQEEENVKVFLEGIFLNEENIETSSKDKVEKSEKYSSTKISGVPVFSEYIKTIK